MKSPLFVKVSHDHCFLQWVTQHLLFMSHLALRLCCYLYPDALSDPGRLLSALEAPGKAWNLKAEKFLLFLPSPGRGYPVGNRVLPLLMKREKEESRRLSFPASDMRLCASSVPGITSRNIVLPLYLSHHEQLLIPPPQKSLWLVSTFTISFFLLPYAKYL